MHQDFSVCHSTVMENRLLVPLIMELFICGIRIGMRRTRMVSHKREIFFFGANGIVTRNINQNKAWVPGLIPSGHFGFVTDLTWDPNGDFLLSTSKDQTTRLYSLWTTKSAKKLGDVTPSWHEISRVQVHGFDINTVSFLESYKIVSGADEKVIRVFEAPQTFVDTLRNVTNVNLSFQRTEPLENIEKIEKEQKKGDKKKNNGHPF